MSETRIVTKLRRSRNVDDDVTFRQRPDASSHHNTVLVECATAFHRLHSNDVVLSAGSLHTIYTFVTFDQYAPPGHHVFQIGVGPVDEATLSLTRAELLAKLSGQQSSSPAARHADTRLVLEAERTP